MTPWLWFAGSLGEPTYDIAEEATRDAVIRSACRELGLGDTFRIVEARMSTDVRHEGCDHVPFLRERNHETLTVGPRRSEGEA